MLSLVALLLAASPNLAAYLKEHNIECPGPQDGEISPPEQREAAGWEYRFEGARASARPLEAGKVTAEIRFGVLAGTKEADDATLALLDDLLAQMVQRHAQAFIAAGDLGMSEEDLEKILGKLAATGLPVYAIPGNSESRTHFNHVSAVLSAQHPNLVDGGLIRRLDLPGATLLSLPGYHDRRFFHDSGVCFIREGEAEKLSALAQGAKQPLVLVAHGPPLGSGRQAIDVETGGAHTGNTAITELLKAAAIRFLVAPHIIEAGEQATNAASKRLSPGAWSDTLWLNPGSASPMPWKMNDGRTTHGAAAMLTLKGGKASYTLLRPRSK